MTVRALGLIIAIGCGIYCTLIFANFEIPKPIHMTIGVTGVILGIVINLMAVYSTNKEGGEDV